MLARLRGTLESLSSNTALIAIDSGAAYEVLLPAVLADDLAARTGSTITLHTVQYLEGQSQGASFIPRLIGFASRDERRFFELFTTVKGLGAKRALRALAAPFPRIAAAVADRDTRFLQTLPEIGKRLAETIVAELHGKVDPFLVPASASSSIEPKSGGVPGASIGSDPALAASARQAIDALVHLGDSRLDAEELVRRALRDARSEPRSADDLLAAAFALRS
jgi:Holliday junction DNA helicase RuvA